ncbi:MAG: contractile injection system protein, VgrG/Pvc8 family [Candidatus Pristimantibacillus sp.]
MESSYEGDGFQLEWPYALKAIRSFRIERRFNAHARCTFTAVMTEEEAEGCMRNSSFQDSLVIRKPSEPKAESWFAGGITHVDIQMEDGIPHVQIEALSRTYAMDVKPRNRSYQNKHLTYSDAIAQLVADYPGGDAQNMATSEQAAIGSLMVQYGETDWQFMKRLASRVGTVILPDVVRDVPRVYFGVPDLSWGLELKAKRYTLMKDRSAYEALKADAEGSEADHIHEADFIQYRIISDQYCQTGDDVVFKNQIWVVSESVISYGSGLLQYEYVLVKRQTLRRKLRRNERIQGVSLEGWVMKRANNMVKVHLDIDDGHDEQGNWWFPYSGEGNNMFHCLPDEGARIKVYFPSGIEKKAMAINSVRGGSEEMKSRTVFQKPTTKVFDMPGEAKMQLGDDGVLFEKGTVSLHLDGGNITVNASEDILLVASNLIELGSGIGSKSASKSEGKEEEEEEEIILESIRMQATKQISMQTNATNYIVMSENQVGIKSGKLDFQKVEASFIDLLTDEEIEQLYVEEQVTQQFKEKMKKAKNALETAFTDRDVLAQQVKQEIRSQVESDPNFKENSGNWIKQNSEEEQKNAYQKLYGQSAGTPEEKSNKEKKAELAEKQKVYDQEDQDRAAVYLWNENVKRVMEEGEAQGKSIEEIQGMLPSPPVLSSSAQPESQQPNLFEQIANVTGVRKWVEDMAPAIDNWRLEHVIPGKPDYLSKNTEKTVYLSRYTFQKLVLDPQILIAEFNIIFGVVAIIAAVPTGGGSLYLLAAADAALGVVMIVVNTEKLIDLNNGNANTNPSLLGLDQEILEKLGIVIAAVTLTSLLKHGLYKAADKLANSKRIVALDDAWKAWKNKSPRTRPIIEEPRKGGQGVNRPIDEYDDADTYRGASKSREQRNRDREEHERREQETHTEGTGEVPEIKSAKEVEIVNQRGESLGEFDEIDLVKKIFYEDKSAQGLDRVNPKTGLPAQTPQQFADKQILTKTRNRINELQNATSTRATKNGSTEIPDLDSIKNIREFVFRLDGNTPELKQAVENSLNQLRKEFPDYKFSAVFGGE